MNKLSLKELKSKKKYHKKKMKFYDKEIIEFENNNKRIGFKHYD